MITPETIIPSCSRLFIVLYCIAVVKKIGTTTGLDCKRCWTNHLHNEHAGFTVDVSILRNITSYLPNGISWISRLFSNGWNSIVPRAIPRTKTELRVQLFRYCNWVQPSMKITTTIMGKNVDDYSNWFINYNFALMMIPIPYYNSISTHRWRSIMNLKLNSTTIMAAAFLPMLNSVPWCIKSERMVHESKELLRWGFVSQQQQSHRTAFKNRMFCAHSRIYHHHYEK